MAKLGSDKKPIVCHVQNEDRIEYVTNLCEKHGWKFIIGIEPDKPEDISDLEKALNPTETKIVKTPKAIKIGRNDPCPCESGKKYKKCCGAV